MSYWKYIDDKRKKKIDRRFVACSEDYELTWIALGLIRILGWRHLNKISRSIRICCRAVGGSRPRKKFIPCLYKVLLFQLKYYPY